jgi:MFS family permease
LVSIVSLTVAVFSIPVALLADRWSRVKSIVLMALLWSTATVGCAFTADYTQLLTLRGLVGLGEAGYARSALPCWRACFQHTYAPEFWQPLGRQRRLARSLASS